MKFFVNPVSAVFCGMIATLLAIAGCAPTQVRAPVKDPTYEARSMQRVLVIVAVRQPRNQKMLEDEFVRNLQKRKKEGVASYTLVREGEQLEEAAWKQLVTSNRFDTVIVSRLIKMDVEQKKQMESDPKFLITPSNGGYGYYGYRYVYQPGFSTTPEETAILETRIFNVAEDKMVWAAQSQTDIEFGRDPEAQIRDFVRLMMGKIFS
jgi:hypothetical protein